MERPLKIAAAMNSSTPTLILRNPNDTDAAITKVIRAAIYARYSSEGNSPLSADEQIERIRYRVLAGMIISKLFPGAKIEISEDWIIKDEAKTGRVGREGFELINSGVQCRAFDVLLVDDISRATRDLGGTIDLYESLVFNDVEGISVSDNITTADPNSKDLFVFKGYANEAQSKNISKNTIRGLELRALKGFSTGHNPYAYFSQATKTLSMKGMEKPSWFEIKINYVQAKIVLRVWDEFAEGKGCRSIAKGLNNDGVPPPYNRRSGATRWTEKAIWNMVNQEKYLGKWKYRLTKVVKNPSTDRLVQKTRMENEHIILQREDLRIISPELERRVLQRKSQIEEDRKENKTASFYSKGSLPKHLFVGSLKCSVCGGNFVIVSGRRNGYLGCINYHRETSINCNNRPMVQMLWAEIALLGELRKHLDNPEAHKKIAKIYNEQMGALVNHAPQKLEALEIRIFELREKAKNYDKYISEGHWSDTVAKNLRETEKTLTALEAEHSYLATQNKDKLYITPAAVKAKMLDLGELLGMAMPDANAKIRALFPEKILMTPMREGQTQYYRANAQLNLFTCSSRDEFQGKFTLTPFETDVTRPQKN